MTTARDVCAADPPAGIRIGMLSTYPPKKCGLATFAAALEYAFMRAGNQVRMIAVDDGSSTDHTPVEVRQRLINGHDESVRTTARTLNDCDLVIIQHEYGIYGGTDGEEVLSVMRRVDTPTIVVLHTVPLTPTVHQHVILEDVCELAQHVVVMTHTAKHRLLEGYAVDETKVAIIPHGSWSPCNVIDDDPWPHDARFEMLTWGLIGPGKGIEHMIDALALLADMANQVHYTVAGATHPKVLAREGDRYRTSLIRRAWTGGASPLVKFDDSYRDVAGLQQLVLSSSVVVLPYDSHDQVTSGVLVDAIAAGRPVIATAFPHAIEMLSSGAGIVVPHRDPFALADAIRSIIKHPSTFRSMADRAREIAPSLSWGNVARRYLDLCAHRQTAPSPSRLAH